MSEKQQRLVLSIIDFLNQSIADGTVKQDDREGLEVAVQCIGEAFGVDPNDQTQVDRLSIKPASLTSLFDLFMKTRERMSGGTPSGSAPSPAPAASSSKVDKEAAEKEKEKGNKFVSAKKYDDAIAAYGRAIELNPSNAVYYSNRAAAHSFNGDHHSAIIDAEKALEIDPKFVKAYSRLGHAHYSLEDYEEAASAYRRGLDIEPGNANLKSALQNSESRIGASSTPEPDISDATAGAPGGAAGLGGLANMFGGGGGGGAGGMPDLASMMNNPMLMQMAQNLMANGGMDELMRNPALQNMASRMQSGNMPSMQEMMADPSLRDLASKFGAGGAGP